MDPVVENYRPQVTEESGTQLAVESGLSDFHTSACFTESCYPSSVPSPEGWGRI